MKKQLIATAVAMTIGTGMTVETQTTESAAQRQGERAREAAVPAEHVTLIGCVEFEQDYRKRMAAGRGGVLGSGVGANDEFVLTNVRPAAAEVGKTGSTGARGSVKPGGGGGVYTLTGVQEKDLKRDVGRQVEIVGVIENAGKPSTGAELTDISDLPRIAISTWHPVGDFCPAK
jgi:hypothetical protein